MKTPEPYICTAENAEKIADWLRNRGGILLWQGEDLSDLKSFTTPYRNAAGEVMSKPHWSCGGAPRHITDAAEVVVSQDREVKRFHVGVRMGAQGFKVKVTDGGSRKIRTSVAAAGKGAYHIFDYETQEAVIMAPVKQVPLSEFFAPAQEARVQA